MIFVMPYWQLSCTGTKIFRPVHELYSHYPVNLILSLKKWHDNIITPRYLFLLTIYVTIIIMIDYKPAPNCKSDDANTAFLQTNFTVKFQRPNQTKHNKELETKASLRTSKAMQYRQDIVTRICCYT